MGDGQRMPPLSLEQLRVEVASGFVDTVVLAMPDMQGRLQGKRFDAVHFLDEVVAHGAEACDYLLAVDVEMNPVPGYALSSWDRGYGDLRLVPDLDTLRRIPWHERTALLLADTVHHDGTPVAAAPRQVLRRQLDRLAERGWTAYVGTELEFCLYRNSYEDAWQRGYADLTPANRYNVDYSLLGTGRVEPVLHDLRTSMTGAGMRVESAKGECNLGQHEIAFRYDEAMATCDNYTVYKTGAKEVAARHGMSLTFMAKPNEREGNSCHIHFSLRDAAGAPLFAAGTGREPLPAAPQMATLAGQVVAGLLATLPELTLLYAPNINSYKRFQPGSFAPTALRWGLDNRTCALRVVGHESSLRVENRVPGGDVNPYLAVAGMIAAALAGVEEDIPLPAPETGNAYVSDAARVPPTLRDALNRWQDSTLARAAFSDEVVDHYANAARVELAAYDAAVTDWELRRGFERM